MKVLLVNAAALKHAKNKAVMPLGLLSIAKYLTDNGHTAEIYDRAVRTAGLKRKLKDFEPDIVGICALSFKRFSDAAYVSKTVKKRGLPVVWGGQMPSAVPELVLQNGVVDYIIIGEGEVTWLALLRAITDCTPLSDVDGLAYLDHGKAVVNKERECSDLAEMPVLDFRFVKPEKYMARYIDCKRMVHLYASKGCPCRCTFCYNHCFHKHLWRPRPAEYFLSEIKYLIEHHGIDGVCFVDDLFGLRPDYIIDVCRKMIESSIGVVWGCNMRADACTKEELEWMHRAGCRWILFGIESGSRERQKKLGKNLDLEKAKEMIEYCGDIGIFTVVSCIIGFPDETREELKQTIKYMRQLNADAKYINFLGILPGSEMYAELLGGGKMTAPVSYLQWEDLRWADHMGLNVSAVPERELKVVHAWFSLKVLTEKHAVADNGKPSRDILKKAFAQTLDIMKSGTFTSLRLLFIAVKELAQFVYYASCFPKIRKEYGLD